MAEKSHVKRQKIAIQCKHIDDPRKYVDEKAKVVRRSQIEKWQVMLCSGSYYPRITGERVTLDNMAPNNREKVQAPRKIMKEVEIHLQ